MVLSVSQLRGELADREAIRDCLYRYARGVDRCDADMVRSAYWLDAEDEHLDFKGGAEEFIAWAMPKLQEMDQSMHMLGNIFIRIDGVRAQVESYYHGHHRVDRDGAKLDMVLAGRYVDQFERRNDEWRIARRIVITDWFRHYPDSADWTAGPMGTKGAPIGKRRPDDLSYTWLGLP